MRIARVVGNITLGRFHPLLAGGALRLVVPMNNDDLHENRFPQSEELVAFDEFGAGIGEWIALSEGAEAAMPFYPDEKPVDAYNAAILDTLELEPPVEE